MVEAIEIFNDALESRRDDCLIKGCKKHSRHETAENNHNLAV
jgi:hypothetical protein